MGADAAFIVEGQCEYDSMLSFICKIHGCHVYFPISNAKGIGNIIKNTSDELLWVIKAHEPKKIIITLDYREAYREGLVSNCVELKELVKQKCDQFIESQENGSLNMPDEIIIIIADKTYESWICADYEALKTNELFDSRKITETYQNVDEEINNPCDWLLSKLKTKVDLKSRQYRKAVSKTLRPDFAYKKSRSFRKFYDEVKKINVA